MYFNVGKDLLRVIFQGTCRNSRMRWGANLLKRKLTIFLLPLIEQSSRNLYPYQQSCVFTLGFLEYFFFFPFLSFPFLFFSFLGLFIFLGPHPWHVEVPRLGVELELQLLAYTTPTASRDLSLVCNLHHSSQQCRILNPLGEARD